MKRIVYFLMVFIVIVAAFLLAKNRDTNNTKTTLAPKLVVGIVVDQMRYDYLYRYYDQYSNNGFKRLLNEGFSCENHHYSYKPTETAPGHASVFSGTTPSIHGIIANNWWLKDEKKMIYCVEDLSVNSVGIKDSSERRSPKNILLTNLSDEIKLSNSYRGKVIGISSKDRGAILPAGKLADAAYWFSGKEGGKFISSSFYLNELPEWVSDFNDSNYTEKFINEGWDILYSPESYYQSNIDDSPYEGDFYGLNKGGKPVFPYDLKSISDKAGDYEIIKYTPHSNTLLTKFSLLAIEKEHLGKDEDCDVLTISYSSPDEVGHIFGTRSMEIQDTYLRLDLELAELFNALDKIVGEGNYLAFLTSDHGVAINAQELIDHNVNVDFFERTEFRKMVKEEAIKKYGLDLVEKVYNQQIFLNEELLAENNIPISEVEEYLSDMIMDFPGVYKSTTATTMRGAAQNGIFLMLQKGYNQKRSGNILYVLKPGWRKYEKKTGTSHLSSYAYDTHVPLLFYGWGIPHGRTTRRTLVEDIAPTITSLLHVNYPMAATGNPIWEIVDKR